MAETILITGGAGFIGSHLVDAYLAKGYTVRVLDNLDPQVHGADRQRPDYLHADAELIEGDVRDPAVVDAALQGVDVVSHQAAAVGVGQSMYAINHYMDVNTRGTAVLLEGLIKHRDHIRKLLVASSMSVYGEGKYLSAEGTAVYPQLRSYEQMARHDWEMHNGRSEQVLKKAPTDETKPLYPTSIYAISKRDQEEMCLTIGHAYGIPTVAFRYFNVYGPRQALSNPYTGIAAIFSSRILNGNPPLIFEDGLQSRDFTSVKDIVQANVLATESAAADHTVLNVGTGLSTTVLEMAEMLKQLLDFEPPVQIVNRFRDGDIRHCYADISKISTLLGYRPSVRLVDGLADLMAWVQTQQPEDHVVEATAELEKQGLTK